MPALPKYGQEMAKKWPPKNSQDMAKIWPRIFNTFQLSGFLTAANKKGVHCTP